MVGRKQSSAVRRFKGWKLRKLEDKHGRGRQYGNSLGGTIEKDLSGLVYIYDKHNRMRMWGQRGHMWMSRIAGVQSGIRRIKRGKFEESKGANGC